MELKAFLRDDSNMIEVKRIYEKAGREDGFRILVDRLWPRGVSKERAHLDLWLKEIAPSSELRKWFAHDPQKWPEFRQRYIHELKQNKEAVEQLKEIVKSQKKVMLLFGTKNEEYNEAQIIKEFLQ